MDFIKKHPCWAIAIIGILAIFLSFFIGQLAAYGFVLMLFVIMFFGIVGIFVLIFNIAAFAAVVNDKSAAGVMLSLPFGGLGAMIGLLFNPSYDKEKNVRIIFSAQLWLVIWAVASFMLFTLGYYSEGMGIPG